MDEDTVLLMELVQDPNFQVLRQRLIENPGFYGELMENLQQNRPEIYDAIQANPQLFMQLMTASGGNMPMNEEGFESGEEEGEGE